MNIELFLILLIIPVCIPIYFFYKRYNGNKLIKEYSSYMSVLQYNMDKAYETVYKDDILIYSVEATKISDKDFDFVTKKFVTLVLKLLGPKLIKEFIFLFGNYDTMVFNIADYFNRKYEEDEVRKGAVENLMESEVEPATSEETLNALRWYIRFTSRNTEEDV